MHFYFSFTQYRHLVAVSNYRKILLFTCDISVPIIVLYCLPCPSASISSKKAFLSSISWKTVKIKEPITIKKDLGTLKWQNKKNVVHDHESQAHIANKGIQLPTCSPLHALRAYYVKHMHVHMKTNNEIGHIVRMI